MFGLAALRRIAGPVAALTAIVMTGCVLAGTASADRALNGCRIVARPTAQHHTSCRAAKLRGAHLAGVDLEHASLIRSDLSRANLAHADLRGADLRGANLARVDLRHANLFGANLARARVGGALLAGVALCRTRLPDGTLNNTNCPPGGGDVPQGAIVCSGQGRCEFDLTILSTKGLAATSAKVVCPTYVAAAPVYVAIDQPPLPPPRTVFDSPNAGLTSPEGLKTIIQPPEDSWVVAWGHYFSRLDKIIWVTYSAYGTGINLPKDRDVPVHGYVTCTDNQDYAYIVPSVLP